MVEILHPAAFIPEQTSIILALRNLNAAKISAALVTDEYGVTVGLISRPGIYAALTGCSIAGEKSAPTEPLMSRRNVWLYERPNWSFPESFRKMPGRPILRRRR